MRGFSNTSAARLMRLLCTQNPFYLISALVVLFGLRRCAAGTELTGGWLLMSVICGYASLLAAAVCIIIWWGRVWDDARMILLVLVLLFLALSVSFDRILLSAPWGGLQFLLFGLLFSVGLSEGVLRLLKMRLSLAYRLPYYVMLAVLFAYPLLLAWFSVLGYDRTLAWGVFLFPWVAAGTFLTLIPAARSGHRDRRPNGTPWTWPLYPWALFVFLWFCFALRTYWICYAFEAPRELQAEFAPHFLAPLVLAAAVLLLEIGIATGRRTVQQVAMLMPLGVVALALLGVGREQTRFIQLLQATVGSPAQLTCWMLLAFYGLGSLRRVRFGEAGLVGALLLCSVVDNQTLSLASLCWPQSLAINVAAALLVSLGIVQQRRWKAVFGGGLFALSSTMRDPMFAYELATLHHGYYSK